MSKERALRSLNEFLFTKIEEEDIGNILFQQDAITQHTVEATLDVLHMHTYKIGHCNLSVKITA